MGPSMNVKKAPGSSGALVKRPICAPRPIWAGHRVCGLSRVTAVWAGDGGGQKQYIFHILARRYKDSAWVFVEHPKICALR